MNKTTRKDEEMTPRSIRIPGNIWLPARRKAGHIPLSLVIREFLRRWLAGEIEIDLNKLEDEN